MVDTCCDPTDIDYVIPANDDATKSIAVVLEAMCAAITEGTEERKLEKEKEKDSQPAAESTEVIAGKRLRQRRERPARAKAVAEESAEETEEETSND